MSKRTIAGAVALLAAPIIVIVATLAQPTLSDDAASQVAALTDHRGAMITSMALSSIAVVLLIAGIIWFALALAPRAPRLAIDSRKEQPTLDGISRKLLFVDELVHRAGYIRVKAAIHAVVPLNRRRIEVPAQSQIDRQSLGDAPVILHPRGIIAVPVDTQQGVGRTAAARQGAAQSRPRPAMAPGPTGESGGSAASFTQLALSAGSASAVSSSDQPGRSAKATGARMSPVISPKAPDLAALI